MRKIIQGLIWLMLLVLLALCYVPYLQGTEMISSSALQVVLILLLFVLLGFSTPFIALGVFGYFGRE